MRLGYRVGNKLFSNKAQALLEAQHDLALVSLYFYDHIYDTVNWQVEPRESWQALIDQQVAAIRGSYDHVAVWYSGGYDSHTIVDSFIRQRLPIDEIIVYRRGWLDYSQKEYDYAANLALTIKANYFPNMRLTTIVKNVHDIIARYKDVKDNWIDNTSNIHNLTVTRRQWDHVTYRKLIGSRSQKRIFIEGRDKPRLDIRDGWWWAMMNDKTAEQAITGSEDDFHFYYASPDIYVKQCYMMINWIEQNFPDFDHQWLHNLQSMGLGKQIYEQWNLAIGRTPLTWPDARFGTGTKLICDNTLYAQDNKVVLDYMNQRDPALFARWQQDMHSLQQVFCHSWDHNQGEFKTVLSKSYPIRPISRRG